VLTFVSFKWRDRHSKTQYTAEHANVLARMVARHYRKPHRFVLITDDPDGCDCETYPLWLDAGDMKHPRGQGRPSCYRRLKLFEPETAQAFGSRIVQLDLDCVITADITTLFDRDEPFVGWRVTNGMKPRVYNGSIWMVEAGAFPHVWGDFDPETTPAKANGAGFIGSDQAVMAYMLGQDQAHWTADDGVLSYRLDRLAHTDLPSHARIVFFHGPDKPWSRTIQGRHEWVARHWC
jgi:hypothetical protein